MIRVVLDGLVKRFDGIAVVDHASMEVRPGELTYLLGPSGRGRRPWPGSWPGWRTWTMARFTSTAARCATCRPASAGSAWCPRTMRSGRT